MKRFVFLPILLAILLSACGPQGPVTLTVMTHDAYAASESVITSFEQANNVKVAFIKSGDAGAALNKAILTKDAPLADVFYGVDNTFLSRAVSAGIYIPYASPLLAQIPSTFKLDPLDDALPVDYGDVCINYDKAYFKNRNLTVPVTLEDLGKPAYKGLLVMENPATSSTGLSFLLATIQHFGTPAYLDYWKSLRTNSLSVVDDWTTAYYTNFSGSSGHGAQPLVVSYASSPAAEGGAIGSILGPGTCFRQIEFVSILKGTRHLALAQKFVDFMLGQQFQQDMPLQMYVYPVNPAAVLPKEFIQYAQVATDPASFDPPLITANRDKWIADWTSVVLQNP